MESDDFNRIIKDETNFLSQEEENNVNEETYKFTETFFIEKAEGAVTSVKDIVEEGKKEEREERREKGRKLCSEVVFTDP